MSEASMSIAAAERPRPPVLNGEQTVGSIAAALAHIYRRHLGTILGCTVLPFTLPVAWLALALFLLPAETSEDSLSLAIAAFGFALLTVYAGLQLLPAAVTALVSDVVENQQPGILRSFAHALRYKGWWHLATTGFVNAVAINIGFLLLVIPGFVLFARTIFAVTVCVLEDKHNIKALRRSMELTEGQSWRIATMYLMSMMSIWSVVFATAVLGTILLVKSPVSWWSLPLLYALLFAVGILPASSITLVLLYYDQRARREGGDTQTAIEELMR